jgi:predicted amidohydrolase YtcJ
VAVNRRDPSGFPAEGWVPGEKISIYEAMKAYTSMGAFSSFEENKKGMLKPGYLADVIVFSQDLFTIPSMEIHRTKIDLTLVDGRKIFERK